MKDLSDPGVRALAVAPETRLVRTAGADDVPELARLINAAFVVERFFKRGDRTTVEELRGLGEELWHASALDHAGRPGESQRLALLAIARLPPAIRDRLLAPAPPPPGFGE